MNQKLFSKDFTLVVIGQIISLFGNATIRFALPLYLLNLTGSSALYGTVTACAFIPAILLSPIGGIVADRVNKRNIMVILDFFTAAVILAFTGVLYKSFPAFLVMCFSLSGFISFFMMPILRSDFLGEDRGALVRAALIGVVLILAGGALEYALSVLFYKKPVSKKVLGEKLSREL